MQLALARPACRTARHPHRVAVADPIQAATAAQLRYVSDERPGLRRVRRGKAFHYLGPEGETLRDLPTLRRIRALAIPPAWTGVWICPIPHGHIQAVGRDARGRKQYRYHPRWRDIRDQTKYARLIEFGPGLPREKVLATVLRLLETTLIRVGNEEYVRQNHSYGLTTLRSQHVTVDGTRLRFEFRGKGGKRHAVALTDRRLARVIRRCQELPGYELFQYVDGDGQRQVIDSADVNGYLRDVGGDDFTAKDFRTWGGTVLAAHALSSRARGGETRDPRRHLAETIRQVARRLGNTAAICRKCYIHPDVIEAHLKSALTSALWATPPAKSPDRMSAAEWAVLRLLESRNGRKLQNRGGPVHSRSLSSQRHARRPQRA